MSPEPESVTPRIIDLVKKASNLRIDPRRLRLYARLLAAAELEDRWNRVGDEHANRASHEAIGELHGLGDGYWNPEQAKRAYRRGLEARQQVHGSSGSARRLMRRLCEVLEANYADLPNHIQRHFPPEKMRDMLECLDQLCRWTKPPAKKRPNRDNSRRVPLAAQTYLWWRHSMGSFSAGGGYRRGSVQEFAGVQASSSLTTFP